MHENDGVLAFPDFTVHLELKHLTEKLDKNELLIFNQKGIDFILAENERLRKLPLYRVILSGGLLSPAARRFAVQWGILSIEPERLPFLCLHGLSGRVLPTLRKVTLKQQDELWEELPRIVVPLQDRLTRIGRMLEGSEECCIGSYRIKWVIDYAQRILGDYYWDAMDENNPNWLEDRFEQLCVDGGLES